MTERERLIELIKQGNGGYDFNSLERIADYLLANGVIVPPCKKGDVVYHLAHGYVYEERFRLANVHYLTNGFPFYEDDIGVTVFVGECAKEEAEKALAERSKG